ncbi:Phenoxybenzoate dioxygenase subunit beta [Pseudomonas sp. 37 R 15]|uniref:PDR/VanB family oxidoreductase n=1 Tax=Pseudomonas sp. 37 R 15 TaxID=1844104 RepID=UPI0008129C13|nr:PDR/VanB family oxidoreductase [Pseudomonas sp. 37 R 15]CRM38063.1 Phenoxybenzoate dioxygenase subunit beta [Pseudomonas sp. 37 R 15]
MTTANLTVRVSQKTSEALDICGIELIDPNHAALPAFSAGSHIDVHLGDGLVRQYSLCNDPKEAHRYVIGVLLDPHTRGGSAAVHALKVGQTLTISEPKNHFPLAHNARHSVLIAGGIGITPILCMAERLSNIGASFELHYCARSSERMPFQARIKESAFLDNVSFYYDTGENSRILNVSKVLAEPVDGNHVYVCGPAGFMAWVLDNATNLGWPDEQLHREYFSGGEIDTTSDGSFEMLIASTGGVIKVGADETALQALLKNGIEVPASCEEGVCGTCLTRILEGTPEHRDMYLTTAEREKGDQFTPCCSRSKTPRLVLDL